MKRTLILILSLVLAGALAGCGTQEAQNESNGLASIAPVESTEPTDTPEPSQEPTSSETNPPAENSNILIVYFSRWGNTDYPDDVDASTSASIVIDENERYGTTEYVANIIQQTVGGDLHRIETVTPYTTDFDELRDVNHQEMDQGFLPELKESNLDIAGYDTVFIGYPVWATGVPQAVISFLNEYDLSGKTVIPFCTHDGYGAGNSYQDIAEASHAAVSLNGIAIDADDVPDSADSVAQWLTEIGISNDAQASETAITITIGEITLEGVLYDTALAEEIKAFFPLTISMVRYGGREYYGGVDFYPENLEGGQRNFEDGDITYCEPHHNMAIFYAQTDDPDLSVDVIPIGRVTSDLSVFANLDSREDITFSLAE